MGKLFFLLKIVLKYISNKNPLELILTDFLCLVNA